MVREAGALGGEKRAEYIARGMPLFSIFFFSFRTGGGGGGCGLRRTLGVDCVCVCVYKCVCVCVAMYGHHEGALIGEKGDRPSTVAQLKAALATRQPLPRRRQTCWAEAYDSAGVARNETVHSEANRTPVLVRFLISPFALFSPVSTSSLRLRLPSLGWPVSMSTHATAAELSRCASIGHWTSLSALCWRAIFSLPLASSSPSPSPCPALRFPLSSFRSHCALLPVFFRPEER